MDEHEQTISKLSQIDPECIDFLSLLTPGNGQREHMDVDVFAVLRAGEQVGLSNYNRLAQLISEFKRVFGPQIHAFSTFRHEMYFIAEMERSGIRGRPFHLLIYPHVFYLCYWEIPSRIRSMLAASSIVYQRQGFEVVDEVIPREKYAPYPFLQILYDSFILHELSNLESPAVLRDVKKSLEFAVKNLTLEAVLSLGSNDRPLNGSWRCVTDSAKILDTNNVDTTILRAMLELRMRRFAADRDVDITGLFMQAFSYYDEIVKCIFRQP